LAKRDSSSKKRSMENRTSTAQADAVAKAIAEQVGLLCPE
jgi:hypothetical protein